MSSNDQAASTAIERARAAYDQMKRRQHDAVVQQRARERSRNIKLAITAAVMITVLLGLSIHNGWLTNSLRSSARQSASARPDNSKFGETRTAPIRSFVKGNTCQEMQFNNDLGVYVRGALVPCEAESKREPYVPLLPSSNPPSKGPRLEAVKDAFTR